MQVLDDGQITDSLGRKIDFKNSIIIMTSNIGSRQLKEFGTGVGFNTTAKSASVEVQSKSVIENALKKCSFIKSIMPVETNIIIFEVIEGIEANHFVHKMKENNILCTGFGGQSIRMVTHLDAPTNMCTKVCEAISAMSF